MTLRDVLSELVCGTVGGSVGCVAGHPLDVVKHRMQSGGAWSSTAHCVRTTWQHEGLRGFYKGLLSPLVGVGAYQAVCFASFDWASRKLDVSDRGSSEEMKRTLIAGTFSGVCTVFVTAPTDHVKIQLALQTESLADAKKARYSSSFHCARVALATGGVRALYRGFTATLLRDVPSTTIYFAAYHWTKTALKKAPSSSSGGASGESSGVGRAEFIAGGVAGVASWASIIPVDTIKTRVQMAPLGSPRKRLIDATRQAFAEEGAASLFRGAPALLLRAFLANAVRFFECTRLVPLTLYANPAHNLTRPSNIFD